VSEISPAADLDRNQPSPAPRQRKSRTRRKPAEFRVPPAIDGIQVNHCRNPNCINFVGARRDESVDGRAARRLRAGALSRRAGTARGSAAKCIEKALAAAIQRGAYRPGRVNPRRARYS
jgi:hypothetical protein